MSWMSSMSCTSTLSSEQTVSSCNLQGIREIRSIHSFHLITRVRMYLVEMRLKTALKLLQLRENRTPQAEFLSSDAYCFHHGTCGWNDRSRAITALQALSHPDACCPLVAGEIKRVYRTSLEEWSTARCSSHFKMKFKRQLWHNGDSSMNGLQSSLTPARHFSSVSMMRSWDR